MKNFRENPEKLHFDPILTTFCSKSREPEFCQTCNFHQKKCIIDLYQHVEYLKKQMKNFRENSKRALFDPVLTTFCPKSQEPEFCQKCGFYQKKCVIGLYQHVQYLKKQMKTFREKSKRALFGPVLTTFCPKSREPDFSWTPNLAHT